MIPKIFHQVWINERTPELSGDFRRYRDQWLVLHPGWQYRLWNLKNIDFTLRRPELLSPGLSYVQMADLLRLEVLHQYGGVYFDTDFEPRKPIDPLLTDVDHVFCTEDGQYVCNAFMAASPGSELMRRCLDALPSTLGVKPPNVETGPIFVTEQILGEGFSDRVRMLPRRLMYPYRSHELHLADGEFPDAYAIHRWAHSWKPEPTLTSRLRDGVRKAGHLVGIGRRA